MRELITITKALSDESRVRALLAVKDHELCVCQIIDLLGLAPSTVSKHMALLMQAGLVTRRKEGRWHFYRAAGAQAAPEVKAALEWVFTALRDDPLLLDDAERLEEVLAQDLEELSACYRT
jgi:DNA-binding transcriptional ArsR family regulator